MKSYVLSINPQTGAPEEEYLQYDSSWLYRVWDNGEAFILELEGEALRNARDYARYQEEHYDKIS